MLVPWSPGPGAAPISSGEIRSYLAWAMDLSTAILASAVVFALGVGAPFSPTPSQSVPDHWSIPALVKSGSW